MKSFQKIIDVRTWSTIIIAAACFLQASQGLAAVIISPHAGEPAGGNTIDWYYWSPLTIAESITDLGGGAYRYDFSFVNRDKSPIWCFGVYTTFPVQNVTTFTGHPGWGAATVRINFVFSEYDARNLDPDIIHDTHTCTKPWQDPVTAIQAGEAVSGFSFTARVYDPLPKYYQYETIASGYTQTNSTGKVAAVGLTPEPTTLLLLGLGGLAVLGQRRRK